MSATRFSLHFLCAVSIGLLDCNVTNQGQDKSCNESPARTDDLVR